MKIYEAQSLTELLEQYALALGLSAVEVKGRFKGFCGFAHSREGITLIEKDTLVDLLYKLGSQWMIDHHAHAYIEDTAEGNYIIMDVK